ncbi:MAG: hypothetical protein ACTSQY_04020 [Candidatus Odinarchaeia archaeon]
MPKKKTSSQKYAKPIRALAIVGSVISLILGILLLFNISFLMGPLFTIIPGWPLVEGLITIVFSIFILTSYGALNIGPKFAHDWPILLIFGIVLIIFGGSIGAVLVIIAGIIGLIEAIS